MVENNSNPFALFMQEMTKVYSQAELARQLDVTEAAISQVINGKRPPTQGLIKKFRERLPDYYPSAMYAAQRTLRVAVPFELSDVGPQQEMCIYALALLQDHDAGEDFYLMLNNLLRMKLKDLGVLQ